MHDLDSLIEGRREEMQNDLKRLIGFESVKASGRPGAPFGDGIRAALDFMLERGRQLGMAAFDDEGFAGHLEIGAGPEIVGVLVHLDVVPANQGWTKPPFTGTLQDGSIFGRGAQDDKGPAVACLHALAALAGLGARPQRRIRLIMGCDEESGSAGIEHYLAHEEHPAFGFSPDASFPLINAEKGLLGLRIRLPSQPAKDDSSVRVASIQGGTRRNIVPDRCTTEVALTSGDLAQQIRRKLLASGCKCSTMDDPRILRIGASGRAAHASTPDKGSNAIGNMLMGLRDIGARLPGPQRDLIAFLAEKLGKATDGSALGIRYVDKITGALTLNVGTIAWNDEGISLQLDIRYPISDTKDRILQQLREAFAPFAGEIEVASEIPPHHVPAGEPLVAKLLKVFHEKTGLEADPFSIGGRTYACLIGNGVAFGPVLPGHPELAHEADEHISLDDLNLCARIYASSMYELAFLP